MDTQIILYFFISILLWGIIWLERDAPQKKKGADDYSFGGIRTFALVALFGSIVTSLSLYIGSLTLVFLSLFILSLFILVSYIYSAFKGWYTGITTEVTMLLTYILWVIVVLGFVKIAVITTVVISLLLSLKWYLQNIKSKISYEEISTTLKFAAISVVILPLLPDVKYSLVNLLGFIGYTGAYQLNWPLGNVAFFNPYGIWFFVVAMSAISYVWYILSKVVGEKSSILLSGAVWGLISSTAVTASMSELSKKDTKNTDMYAVSTLLASSIMFIRVILIVIFFNVAMVNYITLPALSMLVGMWGFIGYFLWKAKKNAPKREKKLSINNEFESPFTIKPALKFAAFVVGIKFVAAVGTLYKDAWGWDVFYYVLGAISGLTDVDAISQTMAVDAKDGSVLAGVAAITIIISIISNNTVKGFMAYKFGEDTFGKIVAAWFAVSMVFWIFWILFSGLF